jgi:hypothetical protein
VSHTNTAVDQALLKIVDDKALGMAFPDGSIVRVGEPRDPRLEAEKFQKVLLSYQVEKRSETLSSEKSQLEAERNQLEIEATELHRKMVIAEWVIEGESDVSALAEQTDAIASLDAKATDLQSQLQMLEQNLLDWREIEQDALVAKQAERAVIRLDRELADLRDNLERVRRSNTALDEGLAKAGRILTRAEELELPRRELEALPPRARLEADVAITRHVVREAEASHTSISHELVEAIKLHQRTSSVGVIRRAWLKLPKPEEQAAEVDRLRDQLEKCEIDFAEVSEKYAQQEALLQKIIGLEEDLAPDASVPRAERQRSFLQDLLKRREVISANTVRLRERITRSETKLAQQCARLNTFKELHGHTPDEVFDLVKQDEERLEQTRLALANLDKQRLPWRNRVEASLQELLLVLAHWGLCEVAEGSGEVMLEQARAAHEQAARMVPQWNMDAVRDRQRQVDERIQAIGEKIGQIEDALKRMEEIIISEARIVATTLTRAYLRDSIQKRRFDTVVLDEASMAPIPALWVAATVAEANVVVVGDFKQLPPIVQSRHNLASQWLGRDIFEAAGLVEAHKRGREPDHFIALTEQHRMHPEISKIPATLIYRNLTDASDLRARHQEEECRLCAWYRQDWGRDSPVLLVDMEPMDAWVTTVSRGNSPSRLNFLSATVCVDLAEQFLKPERRELEPGETKRVLIVCPYSPHAAMLRLLLKEQEIATDVVGGTVHSFQGSEADVVIFDLVVDAPHFMRVNLFTPALEEDMRRLLNVSLTRPRRRLVVVGDFKWCLKNGRHAFLGKELIPFLLRYYPCVDAREIVGEGFAARVARAQMSVLGGEIETNAARLVLTQKEFYRVLFADIAHAKRQVVLFSPFLTTQRVSTLQPVIVSAVERGVRVYVVTRTLGERGRKEKEQYQQNEAALVRWGGTIIHKRGSHEKVIFVDDDILWTGSLNPGSFSNSQEVMERRANKAVASDYAKALRIEDLIAPFQNTLPVCPFCGGEIAAAEGGGSHGEPFYWRCLNCDYRRGIDDPPLQDGVLVFSCGEPACRFGTWGEKPYWFCGCGKNHRLRVHPRHLKLPKMVALLTKAELRLLQRRFARPRSKGPPRPGQQGEFRFDT